MLTVRTWNVCTMWAPGKLELLENEMQRLAEMRFTASGEMHGCKVIWSRNEQKHEANVGFLLSKQARQALLGYKPVSDRVMVARFCGERLLEFALEHDMIICNTKFQQKNCKKWT